MRSKEVLLRASLMASSSLWARHHIQYIHGNLFSTSPFRPAETMFVDAPSVPMPTSFLRCSTSIASIPIRPSELSKHSKSPLAVTAFGLCYSKESHSGVNHLVSSINVTPQHKKKLVIYIPLVSGTIHEK